MADNAHRKTDLKLEEMEKLAGDLSIDCLIIDRLQLLL